MRAVVRLGKIYAGERSSDIPKGLLRYDRGGMKLWPIGTIPLLIDHEEGKRIGRVLGLDTLRDIDGDWLVARADLYPDAPAWIRKGTPASFYSMLLHESSFVEGYVYGAYVREVSLLHREKPAEPGARVALLYEPKATPPPRERANELATGPRAAQLRKPGVLIRDFGEILAVR